MKPKRVYTYPRPQKLFNRQNLFIIADVYESGDYDLYVIDYLKGGRKHRAAISDDTVGGLLADEAIHKDCKQSFAKGVPFISIPLVHFDHVATNIRETEAIPEALF